MRVDRTRFINCTLTGREDTKKLIEKLTEENIPGNCFFFDRLNCEESPIRQHDKDMTLDKYLSLFEGKTHFFHESIILGREELVEESSKRILTISYVVCLGVGEEEKKFFWYFCPLTKENYKHFNEVFKKVYGSDLRDNYK